MTASRTRPAGHGRGAVEGVQQLAERDGRRDGRTGAAVGAGVGDDQVLPGGADRVEQQLPVLRAGVALADPRVARRGRRRRRGCSAAGTRRRPGRAGRRPGAGPSASAPACRRSACRCGSPPGSDGRRAPGSSRARTSASPSSAVLPAACSRRSPSSLTAAAPPASRRRAPRRRGRAPHAPGGPATATGGVLPARTADSGRRRRSTSSQKRPARSIAAESTSSSGVTSSALPSVTAPSSSRSRPSRQVPCARPPRCQAVAVLGVEAPAHAGRGRPLAQPLEVVVVEAEPLPHRGAAGEVEHLRGADASRRQLQQDRQHREQGVGLPQRPVGQPDPQPRRRVRGGVLVARGRRWPR